jgi:hypothetical protein
MKDLSASTILQEVAVKGINVAGEHAPEHALNIGAPMRFESCYRRESNALLRTRTHQ